MHSRKKLAHVAILKNFKVFFRKNPSIFPRDPKFERFENSYYSSRILRQICYNLVKRKFHVQKGERTSFQCERNWPTSGKKTSEMTHLSGRFCFHILKNMPQNNKKRIALGFKSPQRDSRTLRTILVSGCVRKILDQ